ncbi:hypothetical protein GALL_284630 [mine drainage metagenome]|uniref:Circularly permuted ATP-grasp type 2 domain-containing protein n=1 Tax=mine drainage metagenome TaxID=410659 RepID=A0A1J5RJB0_9ZZZZ
MDTSVEPAVSIPYSESGDAAGAPRRAWRALHDWLAEIGGDALHERQREAALAFHRDGITFAVSGDGDGAERSIPFDVVPRIVTAAEWDALQRGLAQRVRALNLFLADVYGAQRILHDKVVPAAAILGNAQYRGAMRGVAVAHGAYAAICGIDLVRTGEREFHVLEDNLRVPSGVSYMLENRRILGWLAPELFQRYRVAPIAHYPELLARTLRELAPPDVDSPSLAVLTPGPFNSAYFEHAFLAQSLGAELVEGQDLFVDGGFVYMKTINGPQRVDVIYRRVDDDFLDPLAFRADSMLGVPGLFDAIRAGHVALANAPGTGVADDKSVYPYVPAMIRYYLDEEPLLANVPTWVLADPAQADHVLANLDELVVKEAQGAGGYGMLIGPLASRAELDEFAARIRAHPERYIAQPTLALSTCPTLVEQGLAPRHVDLRPYVLHGEQIRMVPGGLTRVALREGSLVVNSSQGGGTKDTWVLQD